MCVWVVTKHFTCRHCSCGSYTRTLDYRLEVSMKPEGPGFPQYWQLLCSTAYAWRVPHREHSTTVVSVSTVEYYRLSFVTFHYYQSGQIIVEHHSFNDFCRFLWILVCTVTPIRLIIEGRCHNDCLDIQAVECDSHSHSCQGY